MISIQTEKYGIVDVSTYTSTCTYSKSAGLMFPQVKPLGVIWGKYPQYDRNNTIMFDDLRRNFLMNPQNGLKIRPFREVTQQTE